MIAEQRARDRVRGSRAIEILQREGRGAEIFADDAAPSVFEAGEQHPTPSDFAPPPREEVEDDPPGIPQEDARWLRECPWLADLLPVPDNATWPRLMSGPHPRAVASLGAEFAAYAEERSGRPLRWFQRLVAYRLLEVDEDGRLVWETLLLSMARQLGKSWLLRELCLWRMDNAERFGEEQLVLHTGKDVAICKEVQRPARRWARERPGSYSVRETNGQEEIARFDGSRWLVRAREGVYGYAVSMGVVDEAWKVPAAVVDEGLEPTIAEREQPQIVLVSTAHRRATQLMLARRVVALDELESPGDLLVIEWSAPRDVALDSVEGWRMASPEWSPRRAKLIASRLDKAMAGEESEDEPDPLEAFRSQWLNQWPRRARRSSIIRDEPLFWSGIWNTREADHEATGDLWLAVEDWYGHGAAAAAVGFTDEGPLTVGGWEFDRWADAIAWVKNWTDLRDGCRVLVGASMVEDPLLDVLDVTVTPAGRQQTPAALSLLRELVASRQLVHDGSEDLARQIGEARVTKTTTGLRLGTTRTDLLRCAAWAVHAAWRSQHEAEVAIF